ncbi:MAG: hypothetical protein ABI685_11870 [Ferruginibacter sp.]
MKKNISAVIIATVLFTACKGKSAGGDQTTPKGVAEIIFAAAKSGDYSQLKDLCDASLQPDGDSKHICDVTSGDDKLKTNFKEYFEKGKVVGEAVIEGDKAKIDITFGPDGTKAETFNMAKKDGKWYMVSF